MKKTKILLIVCLLFFGCQKNEDGGWTPDVATNELGDVDRQADCEFFTIWHENLKNNTF